MPPDDTSPPSPAATVQLDRPGEHLTVLADALRDDGEDYEDPPLAEARESAV